MRGSYPESGLVQSKTEGAHEEERAGGDAGLGIAISLNVGKAVIVPSVDTDAKHFACGKTEPNPGSEAKVIAELILHSGKGTSRFLGRVD